jgi:hypothetical protein
MLVPSKRLVNRTIVFVVLLLLLVGIALTGSAWAQDNLPTPGPTLQAGASGDFPQGAPAFGPESGELLHEPNDELVNNVYADITIDNFVVEVIFVNPYDPEPTGWSHGIFFRDQGDSQYRLIFDSFGGWELTLVDAGEFTTLQSGTLGLIRNEKSERNTIRLAADGANGLFSFNGEIVAVLDLSALRDAGEIAVGTGMYTGTEVTEAVTGYEDFTIWSIGILPTQTPTATPASATFRAVIGSNGGEIAIGGGEVWNYEGFEGERLSIRVVAERPAGRETTQELRLAEDLLDTYLIVRAPNGEIIAENDDNEDVPVDDVRITNSFINITLPRNGLYEIEVRSYDDETGGAYTLEIARVRQLSPDSNATPTPPAGARGEGRG